MNFRIIAYIVGWVCNFQAIFMVLPCITALVYQEHEFFAFLISMILCLIAGIPLTARKPKNKVFYTKDGCVAVALSWLALCIFGSVPFVLSGSIPHPIDAFFETVSGFTTTGSSILTDVEVLPHCILMWRSFTHWIGGMGVLVFVLVLTSLDKKNTMYLMRAEVPGPEKDKLVPKAMATARILYGMYFALTAVEIVLLLFGGMSPFDSIIHAFSTAGTGGFSNYANSIGQLDSAYIDGVITVFMILFGINFNLFYLLLLRQFKPVWKNEELRTYLAIIATAIALITWNITSLYGNPLKAFRYAAFQVASIITTTGFSTADYMKWPTMSQTIIIILMIIGACASSTGGGIKVSRFLIVVKSIKKELKQMVHPKSVNLIRINGKKMNPDIVQNVFVYLVAYAGIAGLSVLLVSIDDFDFATNLGSVMGTLNNIGPGLGVSGPAGNFAQFSPFSKLVFCMDMLIGRLEIFPFLMLFTSISWRKKF